jgi:uncharacterized repeat protein (TIGR02543 family)
MYDAYTDAAGRPTPDFINAGGGNIGGLNLAPGLYNWNSGVTIATDVTLTGSASDVWIFQISGTLDVSSGVHVNLSPGVLASNIFWQVTGQTTLGTGSTMNGNILDQTTIVLNTGAALNGRALAQAAVTLDSNAVINPDLLPPTTYNLTYTAGIGGTITAPASSPTTHNTGAVVTITAVAGAGYHFVNWTGDVSTVVSASTASTTLTMNGDYSITANFAPNSYTVTFNNNGGSGVTPTSESATFGQLVTAPTTAPTWAGHILTGWYTLASGGTLWNFGTTTMTAGNMTLYAQWNLAPTVISTVPANGAGGVAINSLHLKTRVHSDWRHGQLRRCHSDLPPDSQPCIRYNIYGHHQHRRTRPGWKCLGRPVCLGFHHRVCFSRRTGLPHKYNHYFGIRVNPGRYRNAWCESSRS